MTWIRNEGIKEVDTRSPVNKFICENVGNLLNGLVMLMSMIMETMFMILSLFVYLLYFPLPVWDTFSVFGNMKNKVERL